MFVFTLRPDGRGPENEGNQELFFDANVIEACGDRIALTPDEVASVVSYRSERQSVGYYVASGFRLGQQIIKLSATESDPSPKRKGFEPYVIDQAYRETCTVTIRAWPSGRLVAIKILTATDPANYYEGDGRVQRAHEIVGAKLADYLTRLARGTIE